MLKRILATAGALVCAHVFSSHAAELKDFPAQTHWVLTVDVKAAHASPLMNLIADKINMGKRQEADRKLAAVKAMFGVDLLNDIDHLVIAGNGDAEKGGIAYVYGHFDAQRLTTILAGTKNYTSTDHDGIAVQCWLDDKDNKQKCLAFAKPGLAMLSNTPTAITDALDVLSGKKAGLSVNSPLKGAFARNGQDLLTLHAFALSTIVGAAPKAEALKQADALSLSIGTTGAESLGATLSVTATTEATALQIQQALQGIQAIAMLRAAEAPESATVATQAKITCKGRTVDVTLTLPRSMIESVLRAREERDAAQKAAAAAPAAAQVN
ncbi:MAG TPA: hypothetical protein PKM57_14915 [Kiritimatiellia bacterium]|nr:hypothetical protein [Kiritimatiellia bacterium]HPS08752.1 hypothetical protein [Kiritimatiellia bacterium]